MTNGINNINNIDNGLVDLCKLGPGLIQITIRLI